ncbi:hypothetical protein P5V15_001109 [Pogonomyrmex californicus]
MGDKEGQRERAMRGMIIGIRREMMESKEERRADREGIIEGRVRVGREKWKIIEIYVKENIDEVLRIMEKLMEEKKEEVNVLIGGNFNARIGREWGAKKREEDYRSGERESQRTER